MIHINVSTFYLSAFQLQRPPSSQLSYGGAMNDDARSPGAGSTPGPLSQQPPVLDTSDPGKCCKKTNILYQFFFKTLNGIVCIKYAYIGDIKNFKSFRCAWDVPLWTSV